MLRSVLDFISPRSCRICGNRLSVNEEEICTVCNWQLPRTHYAETAEDNPVARLFWGRLPLERAASWLYYQSQSPASRLIYELKYHGKGEIGEWLGRISATELMQNSFFEGIDVIVPVPITWRRKWQRGYNQSMEIARGISAVTGLKIVNGAVKRCHFNGSQTHLSSAERQRNVEGAFRLVRPERIAGKHILLVDDILTSGATLSACGEELAKAADVRISIMTIGFTKS